MSDNRPPAAALAPETLRALNATLSPTTTTPPTSSTTPTLAATSPSFAEAQRRLAEQRRQRAAAEAQRRANEAAAAAAQREAAAAARRARLAAAAAATEGASIFSPAASLSRISNSALVAWDGVTQVASTLGSKLGVSNSSDITTASRPAFRVSQVDAELLDEELLDLLRGEVTDALKYVRGGTLQDDWQPEVMLVLRAALFKLTVWDNDATYGAALQNLRYADARVPSSGGKGSAAVPVAPSKIQKALYGLVTVGGRYAWTKWEDWLRDNDGEGDGDEYEDGNDGNEDRAVRQSRIGPTAVRRLARVTAMASNLYAGAAFVSFLVFLRHGRYRTLLDRVLRMRLVPPTSQVSREVSFEYLNRQLVWHAFTEFLLFLLPLVGINRWRRWFTRVWRRTTGVASKAVETLRSIGDVDSDVDCDDFGSDGTGSTRPAEKRGELAFLPERTCAICYEDQNAATSEADMLAAAAASSGVIGSAETDITNPYEAIPCGCVYCYVSLATRLEREEGDGWPCLRCGTLVTACRPWSGDVLEAVAEETAVADENNNVVVVDDSRPSSSSTNASGSPHAPKTVGFADDVKDDVKDDDRNDEVVDDGGDSESEAYEEDEDALEGGGDDDDVEEA